MRGRRPERLTIARRDTDALHSAAHSDSLPWFQVRRAKIVLAIATGEHQSSVAGRLECNETTVWRTCQRYRQGGLATLFADRRRGHTGRPQQISPVQRAQIVELACLEAIARGLHITHWSSEDLARQAVADKIVAEISPATVRRILHDVDLQPHRTRYWKTARLDDRFKERAEQVLWCYGNADRLARRGIWVVCVDEIPTFQVLERTPIRRAIPGSIEQREFDYTRHGTVNMLVFLVVHSGLMELAFLERNDAEHYLPELRLFRQHHQELRGVFLIQDGGSSHIAGSTHRYFAESGGWWRPRYTPANASWLNQGEILIHSFKHYYLNRGSWRSQEEFQSHVMASWPEYNRRYAHPIEWTWTNQKMRQWFERRSPNSLQEL
jgi:transposase